MTYLPYLPEGCDGTLTVAQQRFIEFAVGLQTRLLKKDRPVFKDRVRFCEEMIKLAEHYQWRQHKDAERDSARAGFASLSNRVRQVGASLVALGPVTAKVLDEGLTAQIALSGASDDDFRSHDWSGSLEPLKLLTAALTCLDLAATELSRRARMGRAEMEAEHWAAREFVRICHASGWGPLRMSNSANEVNGAMRAKLPDVVRCLAAVFEMAGVAAPLAESRAMTTLRKLRKSSVSHAVRQVLGVDDAYDDVVWYQVSLQKVVSEDWKSLPNFIPDGHR